MTLKDLNQRYRQTRWRSRAHCAWFRTCAVCLCIYISYITFLAHSGLFQSTVQSAAALGGFAVLCVLVYGLLTRGCTLLENVAPKAAQRRSRMDGRVFAAALCIALAVFGCTFAACYPGGVNYDISNQWRQAHSGEFNNWHPLLHTLLLWLITRVVDSYPFAVLVQIGVFSVCLARLTAVLHKHGVPAWLALTVHAVVVLSLPVRNTLMYAGKDSAMTIGVLMLTAQGIELLFSRGEWLRKPLHAVAFGAALAVTTLLRHNAMLWTYVLLAGVLLCWKAVRRQTILAAGVMAALLLLIQGPLYGALDVIYPSNLAEESLGVPMTILGDVKQREPEKLDDETSAFLASLATDEEWQTTYRLHNYNSIKFTFDREYIAQRSPAEILSMAVRTAAAAPRTAFEAVNGLTDLVWGIDGANEGYPSVRNSGHIPEAAYGSARLNALGLKLCTVLDWVTQVQPLRWLTQNIGAQLLVLLLVTLWALYRCGVSALVLVMPTLLYDLGTMMLLASNDARFFQFSMTIALPCVLALIYLPKEEERCS